MPGSPSTDSPPRKKHDLTQLVTLGGVLITLALTFPQACTAQATLEETRNQREADRAQTDLDRQGQLTDRFSKAVEQLGSDKMQIRLGGIYALDRIAGDSARDYPTVRNVLTTFVREETRALRSPQDGSCPEVPPAADVQATVTVLGPSRTFWEIPETDLSASCLHGVDLFELHLADTDFHSADLSGAHLARADLTDANLARANLRGADLTETYLARAYLPRADLTDAYLRGADVRDSEFSDADLTGANLSEADLTDANFARANLRGADLTFTDLRGADLRDANLRGADLEGANLSGADLDGADLHGVRDWEGALGRPPA